MPPAHPLDLINPDNARILRITAAAGTELADAYSNGTFKTSSREVSYSHIKGVYDLNDLRPPRGLAGSGLPPLSNIPHCCLP